MNAWPAGSAQWRHSVFIVDLLRLHQDLSALPTLSPNAHTNAVFSELVRLATHPEDDQLAGQILANSDVRRIIPGLRRLCAAGESELERSWTRRIIASRNPQEELRNFPYFANYEQLTRLEHHAVLGVAGRRPRRVLFVGGGPLPLTSLLLASRHGHTEIDSIDVDPEAVQLAARLAYVLQVGAVRFRCADVLDCTDIAGYDMVCLAAMVGPQPEEKRRVIEHLYQHMRAGALLLARSARLLRTLLYPPLTLSDLAGFRLLAVLNPYTEVVNSLVVAEKPGAPPPSSGPAHAEELESPPGRSSM